MSLRVLDGKALRAKGVTYSNVHLLRLEAKDKFPRRFSLTENRCLLYTSPSPRD